MAEKRLIDADELLIAFGRVLFNALPLLHGCTQRLAERRNKMSEGTQYA